MGIGLSIGGLVLGFKVAGGWATRYTVHRNLGIACTVLGYQQARTLERAFSAFLFLCAQAPMHVRACMCVHACAHARLALHPLQLLWPACASRPPCMLPLHRSLRCC